jgi:ribosome-associated protein
MKPEELKIRNFEKEILFSATRSSGPGGQNVNKLSTRVELRFNLFSTFLLSESEKQLIFQKLRKKINKEGELLLVSQSERTQLMNKKTVIEKFYKLLSIALTIQTKRKATRPTNSSKIKRLEEKKIRGTIKRLRKDSGKDQTET